MIEKWEIPVEFTLSCGIVFGMGIIPVMLIGWWPGLIVSGLGFGASFGLWYWLKKAMKGLLNDNKLPGTDGEEFYIKINRNQFKNLDNGLEQKDRL